MPESAVQPCDKFRTLLVWWTDTLDSGLDESVELCARNVVLEARGEIPDYDAAILRFQDL
ncbi:hypothetical protein GGS21DRAFT_489513 [Xylaria nigripes]|nr:hypothetical protein GGS21DRAFT_489513 [Xylaria nigripes]